MKIRDVKTHLKFKWLFAAIVVMALAACGAPAPASQPASNISVKDAWARPTIQAEAQVEATADSSGNSGSMDHSTMQIDGPLSAAYMIIENSGGADKLMSVSGDVAEAIEVHQTRESNGMMMMEPVTSGVDVPANGALELKPGSYHIMLMNVKNGLNPGDTFKLTLKFSSGKEIPVDVTVREP
jgi:hypothetical protein